MKNQLLLIASILLVFLTACKQEQAVNEMPLVNYSTIQIPISQLALYADLSQANLLNHKYATRAENDDMVPLNSLLDIENITFLESRGVRYKQIPFLQNREYIEASLQQEKDILSNSDVSHIRKYYIETNQLDKHREFIVTMIASSQYERLNPDFDYLNKPNYTGVVIYSTLEGKLTFSRYYHSGDVYTAPILTPEQIERLQPGDATFITLFEQASTRSDSEPLNPSYCFGVWSLTAPPSYCTADRPGGWGNSSGGGSGNPYGYDERFTLSHLEEQDTPGLEMDYEDPPEDDTVYCLFVSNIPSQIAFYGSGYKSVGSIVAVTPIFLTQSAESIPFEYWVGDLSGHPIYTTIKIESIDKDICSTAVFNIYGGVPCGTNTGGVGTRQMKYNPLATMKIAPSNKYGNYLGGTYGKKYRQYYDEDGNLQYRPHYGLDLYAEIGTPVFAMYDGYITRAILSAPNGYVENSFGNELRVKSTVFDSITGSWSTITVQYAHLQYGNPIAINPRTQQTFGSTDYEMVYAGELIGWTGATGNAAGVPFKHLHLGIMDSTGHWIDPKSYINGTYDPAQVNATAGAIFNINCGSYIRNKIDEEGDSSDEEDNQ